jgi:hypothetical protein
MRILLVSPESKTWSSRKHIPLGLGYLAAVLEKEGHQVLLSSTKRGRLQAKRGHGIASPSWEVPTPR